MKHAGNDALEKLEPILKEIRKLEGLKEKSRGTFYRGSSAFLHFHEDQAGNFADLKIGDEFERFPVNSDREVKIFLNKAAASQKTWSSARQPKSSSISR
ncbi:MAG: hypothetical protein JWM69_1009 [Candidatus Binatus sp.]|jgi:hypothetical protein|nr:hypothetical protein [Candidatus Binatus sp.]